LEISKLFFGGSGFRLFTQVNWPRLWKERLGMSITTYGVGGAGFSSLQGKSCNRQVGTKQEYFELLHSLGLQP